MNDNRLGGSLLVAGSIVSVLVMLVHPAGGHGAMDPSSTARLVLLDRFAHGSALVGVAMVFLGVLTLGQRLKSTDWLPTAALVSYGFAAGAITVAAAMSGFVAADVLSRIAEGGPQADAWRLLLSYTFRVNQAFSAIFTVGSCVAVVLWSVAMRRGGRWPRWLAFYGLTVGLTIPPALFAGWLRLDVHSFGLVVFTQAVWFIAAGISLMRVQTAPEADLLRT